MIRTICFLVSVFGTAIFCPYFDIEGRLSKIENIWKFRSLNKRICLDPTLNQVNYLMLFFRKLQELSSSPIEDAIRLISFINSEEICDSFSYN